MLILTRRVGESILIGNDVEVAVLGMKGNQVRIGIRAPSGVPVHREELLKRGPAQQQPGALDEGEPKKDTRGS